MIEVSGDFGMKVYYGDGTRIDLLRHAGAAEMKALLFCIDGESLTPRRLEPILEAFPQAAVFVRAFDRRHLIELRPHDFKFIIREVFELAVTMGREALKLFCVDEEEVGTGRVRISAARRGAARHPGQLRRPPRPQGTDVQPGQSSGRPRSWLVAEIGNGPRFGEPRHDPFDDLVMRTGGAADDEMRLGIDRVAPLGEARRAPRAGPGPSAAAGRDPGSPGPPGFRSRRRARPRCSAPGSSRRVSSLMNAPPPVAITRGGPATRRAMTRRSPSRKCASPWRSKISAIFMPAARLDLLVRIDELHASAFSPAAGPRSTCRRPSGRPGRSIYRVGWAHHPLSGGYT